MQSSKTFLSKSLFDSSLQIVRREVKLFFSDDFSNLISQKEIFV